MKTFVFSYTKAARGAVLGLFILTVGCATGKSPSEASHQRGWIGGEYKLAVRPDFCGTKDAIWAFPKSLPEAQRSGILVLELGTNAPARTAGLREGDLILSANHRPVRDLAGFRREIDRSVQGTGLPLEVWRDGKAVDCNVTVGRETFRHIGSLSVGLFVGGLKVLPDPGFSWIVAGFEPPRTSRTELDSVKSKYRRDCADGKYEPNEQDWALWLGIFRVTKGKIILAQESAPVSAASPPQQLAPVP